MSSSSGTAFETLGLPPFLVEAVARLEYEEPTPIQKEAIPHLLAGKDVLGLAATGTGKTAAFALPLLARLTAGAGKPFMPLALVLVPTRELALQVTEALHQYGSASGVKVVPVFGGQDIVQQLRLLKRGVDVVVATPGRALDHLKRKSLMLQNLQLVVLDEADEMLDMGFAEDLETLMSSVPEQRQTALFSATMPPRITRLVDRFLRSPVKVSIAKPKVAPGELPKVRQVAYVVPRPFKVAALMRILQLENAPSSLVFCRTRSEVDELTSTLMDLGIRAEALHGGLQQNQRDRVMRSFKSSQSSVLVATDVAARGLHIENLAQVINYDVPSSPEVYVHRIGRTGRAGREGAAITLAEPREHRLLHALEKAAAAKIALLPVPSPRELQAKRSERIRFEVEEHLAFHSASGEPPAPRSSSAESPRSSSAESPRSSSAESPRSSSAESPRSSRAESRDAFSSWLAGLGEGEAARVAAAALELLQRTRFPPTELDVVEVPPFQAREGKPMGKPHREEPRREPMRREPKGEARPKARAPFKKERGEERRPERGESTARLFIGVGKAAGVRPSDLVGAIANETGLPSRQIGPIEIKDRFSLVSVPGSAAQRVIQALRASSIRGRKAQVRLDRPDSGR